jgi:phospholipid transport system substrate-binding protein
MSPTCLTRGILSLFLVWAMAVPLLAANPMEEIKQTTDKILSIVTNPALKAPSKTEEREKLIHQAVYERFDWGEMSRRSLAIHATVKIKIVTKKDKDIPVEYRLKKEGNNWFIYDVSIEGVSLVNNYRTQFNSILLQSSYEDLVKRLREKAEPK